MDLATIQIKVDTRQVKAANEDIKQLGTTGQMTSKKVNAANDDMAKSAKSTTSAFKLLGGAMAALGVGALVTSFARTVTESERLKGSLKTMTGSTEDAAFAFSELEKFASQTPFTLDQSVEGFIKLKALGLDPSERALRSYGNTSAAMGKDMMQMIEAVADASTGEFERLKEFGIKASKQGDDVSLTFQGVTTTIGNSSAEIQNYLLEIGETKFGTAMEDQMKALPGLLSNLSDNVSALFRKIGDVGGVNLFAGAISAASAVIVGITNNLDILGTGLAAATAGFIAFTVGSNLSAILGGMGKIRVAVLALNTAIMSNPIGFVASAIAIAATAIIMNFDKIKVGAEKAAINIQIGFEKLKIFLMESFVSAIEKVGSGFTKMKNDAIAGMAALAAAVKNPTNAIDTFNETFDTTLASLQTGQSRTNVFSDSIEASRNRVDELNEKLAGMNTEVATADENYQDADRSLSDYAIAIDESAVAANELAAETEAARVKTLELLGEISNETEALNMSNVEIAIRNNLQKAGVDATSELGEQIVAATEQLYAEKAAIDATNESTKALEKQHDESQKAIEAEAKRVAEEQSKAYETMKNNISGFFVDLFENGKSAFSNLAESFKAMVMKMVADIIASKVLDYIAKIIGFTGSSTLASAASAITSSAASSALTSAGGGAISSTIGSILAGGGGAAASTAAASSIAAGTSTMAANAALAASTAGTAGASIAAGTSTMAANAAAAAGSTAAAGGGAAASSGFANALATAGPYAAAVIAAYLAAKALDSGGTPTSTAGLTMAKTGGMSDANIFSMPSFESGFAPLGFKQNATNEQAMAAVAPLRELDAALTAITEGAGYGVNLSGHTFNGLGVEGSGPGTVLGMFVEEGKAKGKDIESQMDQYATEWIKAVGVRNGVSDAAIRDIIGDGTAPGIVARAQAVLDSQSIGVMGPTTPAGMGGSGTTLTIDGSHQNGLDMVPYDGYVAELHAGERVQTAEQARASDSVADEMSGLRQSIEDVMIAVARNTSKLYRLNDRWDKNGLPPVRA
jgi:hypothetical protein